MAGLYNKTENALAQQLKRHQDNLTEQTVSLSPAADISENSIFLVVSLLFDRDWIYTLSLALSLL